MKFWHRYPWALRGLALVVAVIAAFSPAMIWPEGVAALEDRIGDTYWRMTASSATERRVVLVDIDERSLREIGAWPWSRATMAKLIDGIRSAGARVQVIDITFAEARQDDAVLQQSFKMAAPVVAQLFSLDPAVRPAVGAVAGGQSGACDETTPPSYGHYGLAPTLLVARPVMGHITPRVDGDGVIRHLPARVCHADRAYPMLALAALWQAAQPGPEAGRPGASDRGTGDWTRVRGGAAAGTAGWWRPAATLTSPSLPGVTVPLDARGNLRVPYHLAREAFISVSAADLLGRTLAPGDLFRGSIVLIGSTAFGMGDTVATPLGAVSSGLEVHAQALTGLIDGAIPFTPVGWPLIQAAVVATIAAILWLGASTGLGAPAKRLPVMGLGLGALVLTAAVVALSVGQAWLPWFTTFAFCLLGAGSLATVEHALARAQRERLSAHLGAYLPAPVAARLMATEPTGKLQFESRQVSVLVSSVRNFSALATLGPPEELAALLHAYCCLAVEVIERHGGVVEHVVGDAVTALWTDGPDCANHPACAAEAACELLRATGALFASRRPVSEDDPMQPLALGIGLETGPVLVGSYGPARRRAHAMLGEPVSVAHRLQEMTADLSVPILLGPQLTARLRGHLVQPLGEFLLEGLGRHLSLATVAGWSELIDVDRQWALAAASAGAGPSGATPWSRWALPPNSTTRTASRTPLTFPLRRDEA